jgi:hypothetical protein
LTFDSFFERLGDLDWLAVVVGAVVFMVVGWLWYGPLFGKQWSAGTGIAMDSSMPATDKLIAMFVYSFVLSGAVNYFGVLDGDVEHSLVTGILLGILVIGSASYAAVVWEKQKQSVWMINTLFLFVAITIVTYVQGLMA